MQTQRFWILAAAIILASIGGGYARAEDAGQADLDKATEAKLGAESLSDLGEVVKLCKSALKAGLDESNTKFANQLLAGTYLQRAEVVCAQIFDRPSPPSSWPQLRQVAVNDLEESLKIEPSQVEGHYMLARLHSLPRGDRKRAVTALDEAIRLSEKEPGTRAKALVMRANLKEDANERQADYDEAVKIAPHNAEVLRSRGLYYLLINKYEPAVADLDASLAIEPENADAHEAKGVALFLSKNYVEALKSFDKAIELAPKSPMAYTHRARIHAIEGDSKAAIKELDKALRINPRSLDVLLLRARVHQQAGDNKKALADVDKVLKIRPDLVQGLQLRAVLAAGAGKFDQAIADLEKLKKAEPDNTELLLQLGMFYAAGKQTEKAVETFDQVIAEDGKNWVAYRGRADAYLNVGKQAEAVADYEEALKLQPKNSGILNNLAWILATSPEGKLRNGKRSIELAKEACEVTEFKQAHILSTLAAAYAESGDFKHAIEWSEKAVDLGTDKVKEQLEKELESYKQSKPWREEQPNPISVEEDGEPSLITSEDEVMEAEDADDATPPSVDDDTPEDGDDAAKPDDDTPDADTPDGDDAARPDEGDGDGPAGKSRPR